MKKVYGLVIVSFILYSEWPSLTGEKVILATAPVDPFDPLRGQYMIINYEISRVPSDFKDGDSVYISLEEDETGIHRSVSASSEKPDGLFIKGKIEGRRVMFGIEQFFFERIAQLPTTNITVEVSITSSGRAGLSQMLHNGEPIEIEYREFDFKTS